MLSRELPHPELVTAAQRGDRGALEELVRACLPLVYNIVGRAAETDLDVDDIVQETMLRMIKGIGTVREPERLRSWVVTIALRQLTEARQRAGRERVLRAAELPDRADPTMDIEQAVTTRHLVSAEQRDLGRAAEWLDDSHRSLLALWWLELRGELSRTELAASLGEPVANTGVRVQRMREQLAVARSVVEALGRVPRCPGVDASLVGWDGTPSPLWRKRIARHLRDCSACGEQARLLASSKRLLAALPLLLPPPDLAPRIMAHWVPSAAAAAPGAGDGPATPTNSTPGAPAPSMSGSSAGKVAVAGKAGLAAKTAAAVAAIVVLAGGAALVAGPDDPIAGSPRPIAAQPTPGSPPPSPAAPVVGSPPAPRSPGPSRTTARSTFRDVVPAFPAANEVTAMGAVRQNVRVAGRDNGQSTGYAGKSVWVFDDTTLEHPFGFLSNSAAITADLDAADGIDLRSSNGFTVRDSQAPVEVVPRTAAERAYEKAHPGVLFGFWPGPVIADPARHRVLFTYGKLCRGSAEGTPCTGPMGKGLGMGIAAMDMRTRKVTRLTVRNTDPVRSQEGVDPTLFFGPTGAIGSAAALVVDGTAYLYGDCAYGCRLARVDLAHIDDLSAWRYHADGQWVRSRADADRLIGQGGAGQTVFYSAGLRAYINVFLPFGTNTVRYQVGGSPAGPWSRDRVLVETAGGGAKNYALFAHPEYAERDGLVQYLTFFHPGSGEQRLLRWTMKK